jgi:hypothetical protein
VRAYTRDLDAEVRDTRRAEIYSDIFEHQRTGTKDSKHRTSAAVAGRTLRGAFGDLAWRREERAMTQTTTHEPRSNQSRGRARLRWLALVALVLAMPFLFNVIMWGETVQLVAVAALVVTAVAIWRVFSGEWPLGLARR